MRSSGAVVVEKVLTTPSTPLDGVRHGVTELLRRAGVRPADITAPIVHATTLITNALIEGKAGRAALVATAGFGDTLLIRDEHRYDMYDLQIEFPAPPIPRDLTFEIAERVLATGVVHTAPAAADLDALAAALRGAEVEAVGVCLLNSYVNAANERHVADHLRAELNVPVCISAEVSPQIREYPRMVTTACNAATMPVIGPYLDELQKWLSAEGFGGAVLMMLSNGGVVSADDAARAPIRLVESGPAAGALAGSWFARRLGEPRLLGFDMGGTTAKACLVEDGEPTLTTSFEVARIYRFKKGSGFPVSVPSIDLVEIGAGGGSIAHTDQFGLLKVGPESAGAEPGPASYGRGGDRPAVTDADVVLGMLDPAAFLGGDMPLDGAAAAAAIDAVGSELGLDTVQAAAGVHEIVNENMAAAARMHAVEAGRRPARRRRARLRWRRAGARLRRRRAARVRPRDLPGQRQRAVRVRHARVADAHRSRPFDAAATRRRRRRRARRAARRAARRGSPRARRGRGVAGRRALPLRARRPLHRPGQRGHRVGRRGRIVAGRRRRRRRRLRARVPPDLRHDDPRRRRRGRDVATLGDRRERARRAGAHGHGRRSGAVRPSPCRVRAQCPRDRHAGVPAQRPRLRRDVRRTGDRRGTRDDGGDSTRLVGRRRRRRHPASPTEQQVPTQR